MTFFYYIFSRKGTLLFDLLILAKIIFEYLNIAHKTKVNVSLLYNTKNIKMLQPKMRYTLNIVYSTEHKVVLSWDLDMFLKENILILGQITCGCVFVWFFMCLFTYTKKIYNAMAMPYNMLRMKQN